MSVVIKSFSGFGKVQRVMFRQTLIRAMSKRSLLGGASNDTNDLNHVTFTIQGEAQLIDELISKINCGNEINSWGAKVDKVIELETIIPISNHQVTTNNVDQFNWNPNVVMYL